MIDRFGSVTATPEMQDKIERVREAARNMESVIGECAPLGREHALAITNLEQAAMWAVKAVAHAGAQGPLTSEAPSTTGTPTKSLKW